MATRKQKREALRLLDEAAKSFIADCVRLGMSAGEISGSLRGIADDCAAGRPIRSRVEAHVDEYLSAGRDPGEMREALRLAGIAPTPAIEALFRKARA